MAVREREALKALERYAREDIFKKCHMVNMELMGFQGEAAKMVFKFFEFDKTSKDDRQTFKKMWNSKLKRKVVTVLNERRTRITTGIGNSLLGCGKCDESAVANSWLV